MKVLVTGASGFLGRHLLAGLMDAPEWEPTGLSRRPERLATAPIASIRADLTSGRDLRDTFSGFDAVIHAAGAVSHDPRHARAMYQAHVEATEAVVTGARRAGVKRVVVISSSGTIAVSETPRTLDENAPSPLGLIKGWPYYRAKLFAEQEALAAAGDGLDVVVLNPSLLLGPSAPDPFAGSLATSAADSVLLPLLRGELQLAPSGGISFVDVRDVAAVAIRALSHGHPSRRYLLAGANWTFAEFYERAARIAGCRAPALKAPRFGARLLGLLPKAAQQRLPATPLELDMASHTWWADSTRARTELAFTPREPLDTLADAVLEAQAALDAE